MHYLHSLEAPVLHRNLKTQNLMLDEGGRVKICPPPKPSPNPKPSPVAQSPSNAHPAYTRP